MREITHHQLPGLNEAIQVHACDEPGPGGANHVYALYGIDPKHIEADGTLDIEKTAAYRFGCRVEFQKGAILESGFNGITNEALLAVLIDRLQGFQGGQFACRENAIALTHLQDAMHWLQHRTRERLSRGVEGKLAK